MSPESFRQVESTQDEAVILKALLDAEGGFISGSLLAKELGISRPAVLGKINKLREIGFDFQAIRNKGYSLVAEPKVIHPSLLQHHMQAADLSFEVLYFPVIDSTNSEAERQLANGRQGPFAVVSSCQTKGRGRLGRDWHSASSENLYLSVVFEPNIPAQRLQPFTLWAGIQICRALQAFTPSRALKIKWPNDLHCEARKFAGMLTEARMDADLLRTIIFGIGINVNSNPNEFPTAFRSQATSLHAICGKALPINQVAVETLSAIDRAYRISIQKSTTESLTEAWAPLSALLGKQISGLQGNRSISGVAESIDENGALQVRAPDGRLQLLHAGDVTLKKEAD
ncbi:MAG: biotin--[acetyl-CoA-carboxylase] ligase [Verrucomicrobiota bacterium]